MSPVGFGRDKTAKVVEKQAEGFLKKGQDIGACESYLRASMYYRFAEFYGFFSEPNKKEYWQKSKECFQKGAELLKNPPEVVEIPFEDMKLPGYFFKAGEDERPTIIVMSGFDGTAEELYFYIGAGALQRGYNVLLFEGPSRVGPYASIQINPFVQIIMVS
ncbi:MAG: hypothetical protein ABFC12_05280 [Methanobacterium sp.]